MIKEIPFIHILVLLILVVAPIRADKRNTWHYRKRPEIKNAFFIGPLPQGPLTVFVHGTKESLISRLVHRVNYPWGIVPASLQGKHSILGCIPSILHQACPEQFHINSFYLYGWHGRLCFKARKKAALVLYKILKDHQGPITLMAHSHGCNVALNIAQVAELYKDRNFKIDRLILLACPVQAVTACYAKSPVFKRVYSFYSTGDLLQIADPQRVYLESRLLCRILRAPLPLFSERLFPPSPNLIQIRILLDKKSPGHINFLLSRFLRKLPAVISLVEGAHATTQQSHFIVNIPRFNGIPHLIDRSQIWYIPRTIWR